MLIESCGIGTAVFNMVKDIRDGKQTIHENLSFSKICIIAISHYTGSDLQIGPVKSSFGYHQWSLFYSCSVSSAVLKLERNDIYFYGYARTP
jgi:hypothetical protein